MYITRISQMNYNFNFYYNYAVFYFLVVATISLEIKKVYV